MLDQRTDVPTVPPVFHVTDTEGGNAVKNSNTKKSGMDVEGEEEEEEEEEGKLSRSASDLSGEIAVGNAAVSDQITLHIRSLNYHIFQLARPECVFADKSLPPEYLEEYLIKQEHFSLVRLVNSTLNAASEAKEGDGRLGLCKDVKWCLFTRTCGELSRIHKDKEIRTFFFRKFQMFEDADEAEIEGRTSVVSLQSVKSIEECDKLFSYFVKSPKKEVFVCVASMQTCSSDQINLIRTKIDTLTNNGSSNASERRHAFYVILHFPPEMQLLQTVSSSQAVFVNNWNYSYVDALGFSLDLEALDRGTSFKEMKKRDVDAKAWLAYAFGLNKKISNRTVENEFKNDIFDKAQAIIKKMASPQGVKRRNNLKYTKDVYSNKIRAQLPKIIDGLKKSARFAEVFDIYVRHVIKIWCNRLLKGIIRMDCAAIKKGEHSSGLLQHLNDALEKLFTPCAKELLKLLCNNLALESICYLKDHLPEKKEEGAEPTELDEELELFKLFVSCVPICGVEEVCRSITLSSMSMNKFALEINYQTPTYLPLFGTAFGMAQHAIERVKSQEGSSSSSAGGAAAFDYMAGRLDERLKKNGLSDVFRYIESSPRLLRWYKRDLVIRGLRAPDLFVPRAAIEKNERGAVWIDVCVKCLEFLTHGHPNSITHLHLVPYFFERETLYLTSIITPLRSLVPSTFWPPRQP